MEEYVLFASSSDDEETAERKKTLPPLHWSSCAVLAAAPLTTTTTCQWASTSIREGIWPRVVWLALLITFCVGVSWLRSLESPPPTTVSSVSPPPVQMTLQTSEISSDDEMSEEEDDGGIQGWTNEVEKKTVWDSQDILEADALCRPMGSPWANDTSACHLGPPYLYVTYHGGKRKKTVHTVCRYTRDGCTLPSLLAPSQEFRPQALRGIILVENDTLLVGESWKKASRIVKYSPCMRGDSNHRRNYLSTFVANAPHVNGGLVHPYGFATWNGGLFVSAQDTGEILRYNISNGQSWPSDYFLQMKKVDKKLLKFDRATFYHVARRGVRGLAFDKRGTLFVADKTQGVHVVSPAGHSSTVWRIKRPISLHYSEDRDSLWVGSSGTHSIYELNAQTGEIIQTITHHWLRHPAGLTIVGDKIFVLSQRKGRLLKFSMKHGDLSSSILKNLPDDAERIILGPC